MFEASGSGTDLEAIARYAIKGNTCQIAAIFVLSTSQPSSETIGCFFFPIRIRCILSDSRETFAGSGQEACPDLHQCKSRSRLVLNDPSPYVKAFNHPPVEDCGSRALLTGRLHRQRQDEEGF